MDKGNVVKLAIVVSLKWPWKCFSEADLWSLSCQGKCRELYNGFYTPQGSVKWTDVVVTAMAL